MAWICDAPDPLCTECVPSSRAVVDLSARMVCKNGLGQLQLLSLALLI
jgi:hypothetical protein